MCCVSYATARRQSVIRHTVGKIQFLGILHYEQRERHAALEAAEHFELGGAIPFPKTLNTVDHSRSFSNLEYNFGNHHSNCITASLGIRMRAT